MKAIFASWKTTVCGILVLLCEGSTLAILPDKYHTVGQAVCTILLALGVISAKDADVSNAALPVEAQKVPTEAQK